MTIRQWVALGYVGVFVLGAVAGGALVQWRLVARQTARLDPQNPHAEFISSLDQRLDLEPKQKALIEAILTRYDPLRARVMAPVEAEMTRVRSDMRREMRSVLNPAQQSKFDELMRAHDERRERRRSAGAAEPSASVRIR